MAINAIDIYCGETAAHVAQVTFFESSFVPLTASTILFPNSISPRTRKGGGGGWVLKYLH